MVGDEIYGRRSTASSGLFSKKISSKRVYFDAAMIKTLYGA
jgi:hypothetical protein